MRLEEKLTGIYHENATAIDYLLKHGLSLKEDNQINIPQTIEKTKKFISEHEEVFNNQRRSARKWIDIVSDARKATSSSWLKENIEKIEQLICILVPIESKNFERVVKEPLRSSACPDSLLELYHFIHKAGNSPNSPTNLSPRLKLSADLTLKYYNLIDPISSLLEKCIVTTNWKLDSKNTQIKAKQFKTENREEALRLENNAKSWILDIAKDKDQISKSWWHENETRVQKLTVVLLGLCEQDEEIKALKELEDYIKNVILSSEVQAQLEQRHNKIYSEHYDLFKYYAEMKV